VGPSIKSTIKPVQDRAPALRTGQGCAGRGYTPGVDGGQICARLRLSCRLALDVIAVGSYPEVHSGYASVYPCTRAPGVHPCTRCAPLARPGPGALPRRPVKTKGTARSRALPHAPHGDLPAGCRSGVYPNWTSDRRANCVRIGCESELLDTRPAKVSEFSLTPSGWRARWRDSESATFGSAPWINAPIASSMVSSWIECSRTRRQARTSCGRSWTRCSLLSETATPSSCTRWTGWREISTIFGGWCGR
jgi:hypothetical protein